MANILVVDDSFVMRKKIIETLHRAGHLIIGEAETGTQACRMYFELRPDLVTLDMTMPNMNGIDTVKKIIQSAPDAKIIMVSAVGQKAQVLEAIQSGAKNYIVKPFEDDKFLEIVNRVLRSGPSPKSAPAPAVNRQQDIPPSPRSELPPFTVENKTSFFLVNINGNFDDNSFNFLNTAVQGLLFVKPLKIVFSFGAVESLDRDITGKVFGMLDMIRNSGATLKVVSSNESFLHAVNSLKYQIPVSLCADISKVEI